MLAFRAAFFFWDLDKGVGVVSVVAVAAGASAVGPVGVDSVGVVGALPSSLLGSKKH